MKLKDAFSWSGTAFGTILTAIQTNEVFQYISLGLTILSTIVAIAYTIYNWWRKAKEDGKITKEEVDDLVDDINQIIDDKNKKVDKDE